MTIILAGVTFIDEPINYDHVENEIEKQVSKFGFNDDQIINIEQKITYGDIIKKGRYSQTYVNCTIYLRGKPTKKPEVALEHN